MKEENKKRLAAIAQKQESINSRILESKKQKEEFRANNLLIAKDFFQKNQNDINALVEEFKSISGFPTVFEMDINSCQIRFKIGLTFQLFISLNEHRGIYQLVHMLPKRFNETAKLTKSEEILIKDFDLDKFEAYCTEFIEEYHKTQHPS
ncbi:hypothetical protein OAU25_02165 [Crocinitomicaceae bacterium]|nr:hypothetical protein [Crocinitomicaceae bacterium]